MAASAAALTSVEALKQYLQFSGSENDALLESLIAAVSAQFTALAGRHLLARAYSPDPASPDYDPDNAILDGNGCPDLLLPQYPVLELEGLRLDGREIAPALGPGRYGWLLDRAAGVVSLSQGVFSQGRRNLAVAYRAGYEQPPADLAQACLEQAATRFQESGAGQGRLGVSARTLADGSVSYQAQALLPQVAAVLERYRARSPL